MNLLSQLQAQLNSCLWRHSPTALQILGYFIENPRWYQQALLLIKKASKEKRRKHSGNRKKKIKASRRWKRATKKVAFLQRKAAAKRQNWVHHQAAHITSGNSLVASEKLEVKNMVRFVQSKTRIGWDG